MEEAGFKLSSQVQKMTSDCLLDNTSNNNNNIKESDQQSNLFTI